MLIAARVAQGIAAAIMVPQVLAILHVSFPAEERVRVVGLFAAVSSLASVSAGPRRADWSGTALFALAAMLLVLPLIEGRNLGCPGGSSRCC